mmetsp:Transcript_1139/g.4789  ORF Transcript_1139/g.4789 Transcript_1139/m.4789 type:complete len:275 (-) Transcript_1139:797-1621(-)
MAQRAIRRRDHGAHQESRADSRRRRETIGDVRGDGTSRAFGGATKRAAVPEPKRRRGAPFERRRGGRADVHRRRFHASCQKLCVSRRQNLSRSRTGSVSGKPAQTRRGAGRGRRRGAGHRGRRGAGGGLARRKRKRSISRSRDGKRSRTRFRRRRKKEALSERAERPGGAAGPVPGCRRRCGRGGCRGAGAQVAAARPTVVRREPVPRGEGEDRTWYKSRRRRGKSRRDERRLGRERRGRLGIGVGIGRSRARASSGGVHAPAQAHPVPRRVHE